MIVVWEMPDKSLALTNVFGNRDVNAEIAKINSERPELAHKFNVETHSDLKIKLDLFFKAIELDESNEPVYNMTKARQIWKEKIRFDRYKKFKELDILSQRALESNDSVALADIAAQKQILRDAPNNPAIDTAATIEELKELYPEILKW